MSKYAWVTLATNDSYSLGALVLGHSLRQTGTPHQLVVLVTPGVTQSMRETLRSVFHEVQEVNILNSKDEANLKLLKRPELGVTFTKLHCWRLTQYEKCVFLDADTMVLENADELFEREELSAAPDVGWPDCFNSGVFVYTPSNATYESLVNFALEKGSFDGGDQGLLNLYFSDWAYKDINKHLPFIYNMCSTACYSYLPAFKQFGGNVKIVHFIANTKPWLQFFDPETRQVKPSYDLQHLTGLLQHWWNIFCSLIHPQLSPEMAGFAGAFARLTLGEPRSAEQSALEDQLRRQGWEVGNIDYMGRDSFDNIWSKICETLANGAAPEKETASDSTDTIQEKATSEQTAESKIDITQTSAKVETKEVQPTVETVPVEKEVESSAPSQEQVKPSALTAEQTDQPSALAESPTAVVEQPIEPPTTVAEKPGDFSVSLEKTIEPPTSFKEKPIEPPTTVTEEAIQPAAPTAEATAQPTEPVAPATEETAQSVEPVVATSEQTTLFTEKPFEAVAPEPPQELQVQATKKEAETILEKSTEVSGAVTEKTDKPSTPVTSVEPSVPVPAAVPSEPTTVPSVPAEAPSVTAEAPSVTAEATSVPAEGTSVPAEAPCVPVEVPSVPVEVPSVPTEGPSVPAAESSVPATESLVIATESSVPATESSVSATESSVPATESSVPATGSSVPATESSVPTPAIPSETIEPSTPTTEKLDSPVPATTTSEKSSELSAPASESLETSSKSQSKPVASETSESQPKATEGPIQPPAEKLVQPLAEKLAQPPIGKPSEVPPSPTEKAPSTPTKEKSKVPVATGGKPTESEKPAKKVAATAEQEKGSGTASTTSEQQNPTPPPRKEKSGAKKSPKSKK